MEGRRSTLNRRKECATDEAEDDAQTGKDAARERWRGGNKGEGAAGEKRSKERAGSEERSTQDARRASTETRRETSAKNPEKMERAERETLKRVGRTRAGHTKDEHARGAAQRA